MFTINARATILGSVCEYWSGTWKNIWRKTARGGTRLSEIYHTTEVDRSAPTALARLCKVLAIGGHRYNRDIGKLRPWLRTASRSWPAEGRVPIEQ
jgi:hypothetical protein